MYNEFQNTDCRNVSQTWQPEGNVTSTLYLQCGELTAIYFGKYVLALKYENITTETTKNIYLGCGAVQSARKNRCFG